MQKTVVAVLSVDEKLLKEGTFASEMGWVEESGIYLRDWCENEKVTAEKHYGEHVILTE